MRPRTFGKDGEVVVKPRKANPGAIQQGADLLHRSAELSLGQHVVVAIHQQDVGHRLKWLDRFQRARDSDRQRRRFGRQIDAVRVRVAHVSGQDLAAIGRLPDEGNSVDRQRHAPPDGGMLETELAVDLRHLCRVTERIGKVADPHRSAMHVSQCDPTLQVTNEGLAADQELIGQGVPGADLDLPAADRTLESRSRLGSDLQVIIDDDRLAVHQETKVRIRFRQGEQLIPERHELRAKRLEWLVPFAVPMRVRDDVDGARAGHALLCENEEREPVGSPSDRQPISRRATSASRRRAPRSSRCPVRSDCH